MADLTAADRKYLGNKNKLYLVDGATNKAYGCETESSISITRDRIEITCKGTGGYKLGLSGDKSMTATATINYSSTDADCKALIEKILADDIDDLTILWGDVEAGGLTISCKATFDNVDISAPNNDVSTMSFGFTSNGVITVATAIA